LLFDEQGQDQEAAPKPHQTPLCLSWLGPILKCLVGRPVMFWKFCDRSLNPSRGITECWAVCVFKCPFPSQREALGALCAKKHTLRPPTLLQTRTATFPANFSCRVFMTRRIDPDSHTANAIILPAPITATGLCECVDDAVFDTPPPPGRPEAIRPPIRPPAHCPPSRRGERGRGGFRRSRLGVLFVFCPQTIVL